MNMQDFKDVADEKAYNALIGANKFISSLERAEKIINSSMESVATDFIRIGFALRQIQEHKYMHKKGYLSIWEYAEKEFHISRSTATRFMKCNELYSVGGYSYCIRPEYKDYSSSQLIEMVGMSEDERKTVKPDNTIQEIRKLKKQKKEDYDSCVIESVRKVCDYCDGSFMDFEGCKEYFENCGKSWSGHGGGGIDFQCEPKKIVINSLSDNKIELSWAKFFKIIKENNMCDVAQETVVESEIIECEACSSVHDKADIVPASEDSDSVRVHNALVTLGLVEFQNVLVATTEVYLLAYARRNIEDILLHLERKDYSQAFFLCIHTLFAVKILKDR